MEQQKKWPFWIAWAPYVLILFEMLYMATPFAVFFYGVYGLPLKILSSNDRTAWLIESIFPHFVQVRSPFINVVLTIGYPLMGLGFVVFVIAFVQIYWSKFVRKRAVTGGVYKFIRHPQYTSWIVFGFGMCLVWSRMLVWLMFVTMCFIYFLLSRIEERECLDEFGDEYRAYLEKTGMFFPRLPKWLPFSFSQFSLNLRINKVVAILILYLFSIVIIAFLGGQLRRLTIASMSTATGKGYMAVSTTLMDPATIKEIIQWLMDSREIIPYLKRDDDNRKKWLLYLLPVNWSISELGTENIREEYVGNGSNPQFDPHSHGNPQDLTPHLKKVIICEALLNVKTIVDSEILAKTKRLFPVLIVTLDHKKRKITAVKKVSPKGNYGDIPVPVF